jgi:GAF domain-containing protein
VKLGGARSTVDVPMLKNNELVGVLSIYRQEVRPFSEKQIELVKNFAAQAVIAIENARLLNELRESLQQQTAAAEILSVISSSPGNLTPVFEAILDNAVNICGARFGNLFLCDGDEFTIVAMYGAPPALSEWWRSNPTIRPGPHTGLARLVKTKQVNQTEDLKAGTAYAERDPLRVVTVEIAGARTLVDIPLLKDDVLVGAIVIYRQEVRLFTDKEIELLTSFAAQAVIAIENARLLNELRESLEQQTATADVLRIISSSPGDLKPVFATILDNALQLCEAAFGFVATYDGERFEHAAQQGVPDALAAYLRKGMDQPRPGDAHWRLVAGEELIHSDQMDEDAYRLGNPLRRAVVDLGGARTALVLALRKDKVLLGALTVYRQEVRPFTDRQVSLLQNFAAQAVIAIENARLLNELRESLDRQTATADILRVIASTPADSQRALDTIAEAASRMFDAADVSFRRLDGNVLRTVSSAGPTNTRMREALPAVPLEQSDPAVRAFLENKQVSIDNRRATLADESGEVARALRSLSIGSQAFTPLSREGSAIGVMIVNRSEVRPFLQAELDLMKGFADQAVIAIENARLLHELRESLQQQTASADVLRIISSSPGELDPVFSTILQNAVRLCEATLGNLFLYNGDDFVSAAVHASSPDYAATRRPGLVIHHAHPEVPLNRVTRTKELIHIADVRSEKAYIDRDPVFCELVEHGGARTLLVVPMLKEDTLVGAVATYRQEVRPFTDKQVELVKNFAAQAVIAIENARLLNELRERTAQLEIRSQEIAKLNAQLEQRVADQVGEIERMGRLRRFLPPQVADLIVASGTEKQLESHRREITALFCDLRGFTGFSESSDPEDVMTLLRQYHAAIGEIIIKYSGTLERYAGDGVMVVFNDPVPVDNPALQAVCMALDMRGALGALIEKWRRLGHELGFGIGIAHGYATLGTIGFEGRFDYAAIGTVSNVASRLCDEAKPGQILISPRVLMAVEDAVAVEPVGDFALKGISRPLAAYNVVGAK